jgi:20S proteasome alpha/beta subunit
MTSRPSPNPKLKRPLRRKVVTFILGLHCHDGLVLCSDSLEADGYTKKMVKKIFDYEIEGKWGIAFGSAGTGAACTNFSDRLLELLNDKEPYDRRGTEKLIEATMSYMRSEYPAESLDAVIGLWSHSPAETRLYRAQSNTQCLSVESNYVCAGLDVSLARFLLDSVFTSDACVNDGVYLAPFVTSVMKDKADGVGGPTQLLFHHAGGKRWAEPSKGAMVKIEKGGFIEGNFSFTELEKAVRRFCWSRLPHEFRPEND